MSATGSSWGANASRWFVSRSPLTRHAVLAVLVVITGLAAVELALGFGWHPVDPWDYRITVVLTALAVLGARRFPLPTLTAIAIVVGWPWWAFDVPEPRVVPLVVASFVAASWAPRFRAGLVVAGVGALLGAFPGLILELFSGASLHQVLDKNDPSQHLLSGAFVIVACLFGLSTKRLRLAAEALQQRNEQLTRLKGVERDRAIADERIAISRDIHDAVAHHVIAIVVQSQAARRVIPDTDGSAQALRDIEETGSRALTAMRRAVGALRSEPAEGRTLEEALSHAIESAEIAGLEVRVDAPEGLDVAPHARTVIVRVVQEALTNVLMHSTARTAHITVETTRTRLHVKIADDGSPVAHKTGESGGYGIPGMRERASFLGGSVAAGSHATGWLVDLELPLDIIPGTGASS